MMETFQQRRLRNLLYTVNSRRQSLLAEGWLQDRPDLVTQQQWQSWRRRTAVGERVSETPARIIRSGAEIPPIRPQESASITRVTLPFAVGYRVSGPHDPNLAEFDSEADFLLTRDKVSEARSTDAIVGHIHSRLQLLDLDVSRVGLSLGQHSEYAFERLRHGLLFPQVGAGALYRVYERWLREHVQCEKQTCLGHLLYRPLADEACQRVLGYLTRVSLISPSGPLYATMELANLGSDILAGSPDDRLLAIASGERLHLRIPLDLEGDQVYYEPAAMVVVDERGYPNDPLHLLLESGRMEYDRQIDTVMRARWLPAVNRVGCFGRWAFLRLEGDAVTQARCLRQHLDKITCPESPCNYS